MLQRITSVGLLIAVMGILPSRAVAVAPLESSASVLVLPYIADDVEHHRETLLTITNGDSQAYTLLLTFVFAEDWNGVNLQCVVTASETTLIRIEPGIGASGVHLECLDPFTGETSNKDIIIGSTRGMVLAAVISPETGNVVNRNVLFGDATIVESGAVVDTNTGHAYSVPGYPVKAGVEMVDDDPVFTFDGLHLEEQPATLFANFRAPTTSVGSEEAGLTGELLLLALDGTVRDPAGPNARLDIFFFDDDEAPISAQHSFDCFDLVDLVDIDPNFQAPFLGSAGGSIFLSPTDADQISNNHDTRYGNGNAIRVIPVIGWLIQRQTEPDGGTRAYARRLLRSNSPVDRDGTDVPVIDTTN